VVSVLDTKLGRDLWRVRGQALAIALVIATGSLLLVMMEGLVLSLEQTRQAYYERYRLADVFADVRRAPEAVLADLASIDGVDAVEGRIRGGALIDTASGAAPVRALAVSLPDFGLPGLNDILVVSGRLPETGRHDEVLLLKGYADAWKLIPGDRISLSLNGFRRTFRISGLAQSPEFIYSAAPGELAPDDARFAVLWFRHEVLASAYDMEGAFNESLISLARGGNEADVILKANRVLSRYGGGAAYGLAEQFSNRFVTEEISSLRVSARATPPIFMMVAAFLLYIVMTRLIEAERRQIGLLKAFGYTSFEAAWHYLKFCLVIASVGALLGCIGGVVLGSYMAEYYKVYYKFPFLVFHIDPASILMSLAFSILTASAGAIVVLMRLFDLTPAAAMRPPAPADFSRSALIAGSLKSLLDQPSRMVLRRLLRQPVRALAASLGIASGMGLSVAMLGVMSGFERMVDVSFDVADRSDMQVVFNEPLGPEALHSIRRLDGVIEAEGFRSVAVVLRHGLASHRGAVTGLPERPRLSQALTLDLRPILMRRDGLILAQSLARKLGVQPGDVLTVEVLEGRRPVVDIPVAALTTALVGAPVYLEASALNASLGEVGRVSGAYLRTDAAMSKALVEELKGMPGVAGVSPKADARASMRKIMDQGAGAIRYVMALVAGLITFGVVYNSARIAFAERAHELASLRVIGFTRGEAGFVLLGELGVITLLALPIGALAGTWLAGAIAAGFSSELYEVPGKVTAGDMAFAAIVVIVAALVSGFLVRRDADRLDLVSALKTRE